MVFDLVNFGFGVCVSVVVVIVRFVGNSGRIFQGWSWCGGFEDCDGNADGCGGGV